MCQYTSYLNARQRTRQKKDTSSDFPVEQFSKGWFIRYTHVCVVAVMANDKISLLWRDEIF